jgi:hypothetical protein
MTQMAPLMKRKWAVLNGLHQVTAGTVLNGLHQVTAGTVLNGLHQVTAGTVLNQTVDTQN